MQSQESSGDQNPQGNPLPESHDCLERLIAEHGDVHIATLVELITLTSRVEAGMQSHHTPH